MIANRFYKIFLFSFLIIHIPPFLSDAKSTSGILKEILSASRVRKYKDGYLISINPKPSCEGFSCLPRDFEELDIDKYLKRIPEEPTDGIYCSSK